MSTELFLGIDVGSTTVKIVALERSGKLLAWRYERAMGQPRPTALAAAASVAAELGMDLEELSARATAVGFTGSGGRPVAELLGGRHVNELVAQVRAIGEYVPQARTIVEIGGQDSKFMSVVWDETLGKMILADMALNNLCAAGTGAFLDQQAERLGIAIDSQFADIAMRSENPAAHCRALHRLRQVRHDPLAAKGHAAGGHPGGAGDGAGAQLQERDRQGQSLHAAGRLSGRRGL